MSSMHKVANRIKGGEKFSRANTRLKTNLE